ILLLYAGFRFGIDYVRYFENQSNFLINQLISLGLAAIAVWVMIKGRRGHVQTPTPDTKGVVP
ncbi:MAG: hypothetical protein ABIK62_01470, partial [candidate division WOR-3 bacterium]